MHPSRISSGDARSCLIYHFMFGPDYTAGCPACSAIADGFNGFTVHLANHDVMLWAVSRAPFAKLQAYRQRMGWTFPWASSFASDFNADFNVWFSEQQQREGDIQYNYQREAPAPWQGTEKREPDVPSGDIPSRSIPDGAALFASMSGTDKATYTRERPGMSALVREAGTIYHTYSAYARGLDGLWGMYQWLDRAPKGRNEEGVWFRRRDEVPQRELPGRLGAALRRERRDHEWSWARRCRRWAACRCPAAGRCRWHGCLCPGSRSLSWRSRSLACGS